MNPPIRTAGDYRLVDLLGRGGIGEVYRAAHVGTGRIVAIKMLTMQSSEILQRFENEARLQSSLSHPNIARVEGLVESEGRHCLAMEYIEGETLAERIAQRGGMQPEDAFAIFRQIVTATAYLHEAGIVHRDLKPTNIRVTPGGVAKLLDFGIAKGDLSPALTRFGDIVGTPLYLSPEQLNSGGASTQSDIWALGVLLYEMLVGRTPFAADTFDVLCTKVRAGRYTPPSAVIGVDAGNRSLVKTADSVIAQCLSAEPANRPSAARLLRTIDRMRTPRAIVERLPQPFTRSGAACQPGRARQRSLSAQQPSVCSSCCSPVWDSTAARARRMRGDRNT